MAQRAATRRVTVTVTTAVALMLIGAMSAMACTNLATLNLGTTYAASGQTVDVTGSSFSPVGEGTQPVELRWNALDGPLLAEVEPDGNGSFTAEITVPEDAEAGHYVVVGRQLATEPGHGLEAGEETFAPVFGTPARASLVIGDPAAPQAIDAGAEPTGAPTTDSSSLLIASALLGVLAIGLLGVGLALFTRELQHRRRSTPATSPVQDAGNH